MSAIKPSEKLRPIRWMKLTLLLLMASMSVAAQDMAKLAELAEQGEPEAQNQLGIIYASGNGVRQDFNKAAELFEKSAIQGLPGAQYNLGRLYQMGRGVPKDDAMAASWTRRAAEGGDAMAQYSLGFMFANGVGVERNPELAALWISKAADQGLPIAQQAIERLQSIMQEMQAETEPISAESMSANAPANDGNQDIRTPDGESDSEGVKQREDEPAQTGQNRASGDHPKARGNDPEISEMEQSSQSFLKDRRIWMVLAGVLVLLGTYWLLRTRPRL